MFRRNVRGSVAPRVSRIDIGLRIHKELQTLKMVPEHRFVDRRLRFFDGGCVDICFVGNKQLQNLEVAVLCSNCNSTGTYVGD